MSQPALAQHDATYPTQSLEGRPQAQPDELSGAVPLSRAGELPSTAEQYHALETEIAKTKPGVDEAKRKSDALRAETASLRRRLIETAARVQSLEDNKDELDAEIASLATEQRSRSASFAQQRGAVAKLLAVLERLQLDMPPVLAMRSDDALGAARGAMVLGAALPRIYAAAADLARKLDELTRTRAALVQRRTAGVRNAAAIAIARTELDQLLAMKALEADEAATRYGDLATELDDAADRAASLGALMAKVAALRAGPASQSVVVVAAQNASLDLQRGSLLRPVAGRAVADDTDGPDGEKAPGLSFMAPPGARVVAPADAQVLFAGPYHKAGLVLILQSAGGYALVLAGLERVDVRSGDQLLAGEPLGTMPRSGAEARLYFELRQNGKGVNPTPWLEIDPKRAKRT